MTTKTYGNKRTATYGLRRTNSFAWGGKSYGNVCEHHVPLPRSWIITYSGIAPCDTWVSFPPPASYNAYLPSEANGSYSIPASQFGFTNDVAPIFADLGSRNYCYRGGTPFCATMDSNGGVVYLRSGIGIVCENLVEGVYTGFRYKPTLSIPDWSVMFNNYSAFPVIDYVDIIEANKYPPVSYTVPNVDIYFAPCGGTEFATPQAKRVDVTVTITPEYDY